MELRNGVFRAPLLSQHKWLFHGFGTRDTAPDAGLPAAHLKQIHSDIVQVVERPGEGGRGDAIVTATHGMQLKVFTADCVPILLADTEHRAIAAIHAGWRGTLKRLAEKTVGVMRRQFGSDPARIIAAIGPSIQKCCYGVGEEVISQFRSQFAYADELFEVDADNPADVMLPRQIMSGNHGLMRDLETGKGRLNLEEANYRQLLDAGVVPDHISRGSPCTACRSDLFYSYRKEGPRKGGMVSAIAVREGKL